MDPTKRTAAYGGPGWAARTASHRDEIGSLWSACGVDNECGALRAVLLHRPGRELEASCDPESVLMLAPVDPARAAAQHEGLVAAYRAAGVEVRLVDPPVAVPPNLLFVADLLWMTPEGAVLGRPASPVRAGEERWVARRLADLGIPILRTLRGAACFEGADAAWIDPRTVLVGRGVRTNDEAVRSLHELLAPLGVACRVVDLPAEVMHLMGVLRIVDRDLALGWPDRLPEAAVELLRERGVETVFLRDAGELERGMALNLVTLGPRHVLMADGNPRTRALCEAHGIRCETVAVDEIHKAAGGIGCMTGVLRRAPRGS